MIEKIKMRKGMNHQVVGFLFCVEERKLLLIEKQRPEWQRGYLNGVGGHVEDGETFVKAMAREFQEEAGIWIKPVLWTEILEMRYIYKDKTLHFFRAHVSLERMESARQITDERIEIVKYPLDSELKVISNLFWLVPLCFDYSVKIPVIVELMI